MRGITSQRFRSPSLFLLALLLGTAGAPLSAQSGWSVGPWVGGAWHGELYHHRVDYEFAPGTVTAGGYIGNDLEELTVETGPVLGGRVNRHFAGGWTATVEAGFGSGEYVYHASGEVRSPGTEQRDWYEERWRADSRYRVLGLSAGRAVAVGAAAELSLSVAALWQRHDLTLPRHAVPLP